MKKNEDKEKVRVTIWTTRELVDEYDRIARGLGTGFNRSIVMNMKLGEALEPEAKRLFDAVVATLSGEEGEE